MDNSLSLGLLHGLLYGITPIAPWLVALKRYITEGQEKGLAAYAGTLFGQVAMLSLAFFGWKELVWFWFYIEPFLVVLGFMVVFNCARECWFIRAIEIKTHKVRTVREGLRYFLFGAALMFCNPGSLGGTKALLASVPENRFIYLGAFTLACASGMFILWWTVGQYFFGKLGQLRGYDLSLQKTRARHQARRLSLALMVCMFLQASSISSEPLWLYHFDNLIGYTPFEKLAFKYSRDNVTVEETVSGELEKNTFEQSTAEFNRTGHPQLMVTETNELPPWNTDYYYTKFNERIERKVPANIEREERTIYEFNGPNSETVKLRVHPLRLLFLPHWEKTQKYVDELSTIRQELDAKIMQEGQPKLQRMFFPDSKEYEVDLNFFDPEPINKRERLLLNGYLLDNPIDFSSHEYFHQGWDGGTEVSFAKLQPLPKEVRFPWDYPAVNAKAAPILPINTPDLEAMEQTNAMVNLNMQFLDPIALNSRLRVNDPENIALQTALDGPDKFDIWTKNAYRRHWRWYNQAQMEVSLSNVPEGEDLWPRAKVGTAPVSKSPS